MYLVVIIVFVDHNYRSFFIVWFTVITSKMENKDINNTDKLNCEHIATTRNYDAVEEMPSLDALSFEHEQCTSRNCHCWHHCNEANAATICPSPFAIRSSLPPSVKETHLSKSACGGESSAQTVNVVGTATPYIFGAVTQSGSGGNNLLVPREMPSFDSTRMFGEQHTSRAEFKSFSQLLLLGSSNANSTSPSTESSVHFSSAQYLNRDPCPRQHADSPVNTSNSLDLSALQSVLESSTDDHQSDDHSSCPEHLHRSPSGFLRPCTCAQQAAKCDDWTADELAGYFENLCYIPKKMSAMAEMMYM